MCLYVATHANVNVDMDCVVVMLKYYQWVCSTTSTAGQD